MALKAGLRGRIDAGCPPPARPAPWSSSFAKGVALRGRVVGPDGAPTADAAIAVTELGPMFSIAVHGRRAASSCRPWTRSDAEGRFAVHVNPARHQLSFRKPGYAPKVVDVADPGTAPELEVVLEPGAAVRGRVVRADGRGLADATLTLQDLSTPPLAAATAVTEADGSFALADVAPGAYELQVAHDTGIAGHAPGAGAGGRPRVELGADGHRARARDRRRDARAGAGIPGRGRPRVREAPDDDFTGSRAEEVSAADGAFVVEDVPVGAFTLTVSAEGYRTKAMENVAVSAEAGAPEIEVALEPGVSVRGRVTERRSAARGRAGHRGSPGRPRRGAARPRTKTATTR